ncbi:3-isopropylmalate dehydratase small subunit [Candidatus Sumerlaeota bacterium]|nr:3-isopropylmalate dehydratase small subunit [Candidatus Sumerlaeota bacterium]
MQQQFSGKAWVFGDDVNTDVIFPGKYTYTINDPVEMAQHAMEDADPSFAGAVQPGDIVVAGKNFGCGSSREQAATCLKAAGVACVVAGSFSRIYFRNAINLGLPIVACPELVGRIQPGDTVSVDLANGRIGVNGVATYAFAPLPEEVFQILEAGGLVPYVKSRLEQQSV